MVDLLDVNRSAVAMELENIYPVGAEGRRGEGQYAEAAREASRELPGMPCQHWQWNAPNTKTRHRA
jgi:hypothetical protein